MRRIDVLDPGALDGLQIVTADHLARLVRVHDIVAEAETWAAERKAMLAAEIDAERRAAHERAYAEGLAQFAQAVSRYDREAEALAGRVIALVRACLTRVLTSLPPEAVLHDMIAPVLRDIRSDQEIMVMVHPDRLPDIRAAIARASSFWPAGIDLTPQADAAVAPDECLIYTQEDVFSVSIPLTCDLLCRALSDALGEGNGDVG
jgi:flagellar biosynthesis/type III secretory pathway protein FliH